MTTPTSPSLSPIPFVDLKTQYRELKAEIDARIHKVLDHGGFILGPEVEECERELAKYSGAKHAITCASGTDAAVIAMMALGIGPGDEVITTAFSFFATAESVVLVGAKPVFVDIDPITYNIDPKLIEAAITPRTKAIQPVSLYGQPADMDEINAIAKKHGLHVLEDGAQSFGALYKEQRSCHLSLVGVTSFFPAKPLGCYGDGGAIFTDDDQLAQACKEIRVHGQTERYFHPRIGVNGRLDTLQCTILIPKLKRLDQELRARQELADAYSQAFEPLLKKGVRLPRIKSDRTTAWAQYTLWVPNRVEFEMKMKAAAVPTSVHYPRTMPAQPSLTQYAPTKWAVPHSEEAARGVISLPMHPYVLPEHRERIITATLAALSPS